MENIAEELGWKPIQVMALISVNLLFKDVELLLTGYRTSGLGVSADFRLPCPGENMMKMMIMPR